MSIATLTDKDLRLRDAVVQQLEWEPAVDATGVGVTAREGAVTLTGSINTYAGKRQNEPPNAFPACARLPTIST